MRDFTVYCGLNVISSITDTLDTAITVSKICQDLGLSLIFKASFDKANRSHPTSFRGVGLEEGVVILQFVKKLSDVKIITDVHTVSQVEVVNEVADVLQLPAFLSRQTDLIEALASTNKPILVKKMQCASASEMGYIVEKFNYFGNSKIILCERGTMFGYNNLVVDMLNLSIMKGLNAPVVFDVSHSLQLPGLPASTLYGTGRGDYIEKLALAAVSQDINGLFIEVHKDPSKALCDKHTQLKLSNLKSVLTKVKAMNDFVSNLC